MEEQISAGLPSDRLKKTGAEQAILRNLQELEVELSEGIGPLRKGELISQINDLKSQLVRLQGSDYSDLGGEKGRFEVSLQEAGRKPENAAEESGLLKDSKPALHASAQSQGTEQKFRLYKVLLKKYSSLINKAERKTVGEIKGLVTNEDLTIQSVIESHMPRAYSFEKHYLLTAKKIFEFILREINFTKSDLELNFWLSPKEILSEKIGDDEDLAVFLCSLLYSLGDEKAEVVIAELDDLTTHAFVVTEFSGRFILLDPSQKKPFEEFTGEKKEIIKSYSFNRAKIRRFLYRFNHNNYEQFV